MSRSFVCLLSKGAIRNSQNPRQNFEMLTKSSPCDNFLLELNLAIELHGMGYLSNIYPVMIGDFNSQTQTYGNYFKDGCHPTCPDVCVSSVETDLLEHMAHEALGTPLVSHRTVSSVLSTITKFQGTFVEGNRATSLRRISEEILKMASPRTPRLEVSAPQRSVSFYDLSCLTPQKRVSGVGGFNSSDLTSSSDSAVDDTTAGLSSGRAKVSFADSQSHYQSAHLTAVSLQTKALIVNHSNSSTLYQGNISMGTESISTSLPTTKAAGNAFVANHSHTQSLQGSSSLSTEESAGAYMDDPNSMNSTFWEF